MSQYSHDKEIAEIWAMLKTLTLTSQETNLKIQEMNDDTNLKIQKMNDDTNLKIQKMNDDTKLKIQEYVNDMRNTSKDTEKKIKTLSQLFEDQWGRLMEAMVEGGVLDLFQNQNIDVKEVHQRVRTRKNGKHMEIDLLLENGSEAVIVEVKTTLRANHVHLFLDRLNQFPLFFPKYQSYTIYGAMAGLRIIQEADSYASKNGLFVIKVGSKNLITLLNDSDFVPKQFQSKPS